jgi:hypothetical protein
MFPRQVEESMADHMIQSQGAKARPGEPTLADVGLRVLARGDGTWLEFTTSKGAHARIDVRRIADQAGDGGAAVIREWCADRQALTTL